MGGAFTGMGMLKGFVFTVDSIFSLVVASAAVSLLLYTYYVTPASYQQTSTEAYSVMQALSMTTMLQASQSLNWAKYAVQGYQSEQYGWPEYGDNSSLASSSPEYGPAGPDLLFQVPANGLLYTAPVAADGMVMFTTSSNSRLYIVNATTGNILVNTTVGGPFSSAPMVYNHVVYTTNTAKYLNAMSETGNVIWGTGISSSPTGQNAIITMADGYVQLMGNFYYPFNGAMVGSIGGGMPAAYWDGEFIWLTNGGAAAASVNAFSLSSNGLPVQLWTYNLILTTTSTLPSIGSNYIVAETSNQLTLLTIGGNFVWQRALRWPLRGNAAISNGYLYVETTNNVYGFGAQPPTPQTIFDSTIINNANMTPSAARNLLYAMPNDNEIKGYGLLSGATLWNLTLPSAPGNGKNYGDVALAYGNAYVANGNTLYAFGMCKADPYDSVLHAAATMYLNGNGACANMILNSSYSSENYAVFINNRYAPSLYAAHFAGTATDSIIDVTDANNLQSQGPLAMSVWVYPVSGGALRTIAYKGAAYNIELTATNTVRFSDDSGDGITTTTNVPLDTWTNLVGTFTGTGGEPLSTSNTLVYYNGMQQPGSVAGTWASTGGGGQPIYVGMLGGGTQPFNGFIANLQVYNTSLTANQAESIYLAGPAGAPIMAHNLVGWWPLIGDTNDYSGFFHTGFPSNVVFAPSSFAPPALQNAYQVSTATVPMSMDVGGINGEYNVSVVVWR